MIKPLNHDEAYIKVRDRSMFEWHRWSVVQSVIATIPAGCLVECGVSSGGVTAYMALRCPDRHVYGYCGFDRGLIGTTSIDGNLADGMVASSPIEYVRNWIGDLGLTNVTLVPGDIRQTLPEEHEKIAMAVVDLNICEPTRYAIKWVVAHANPGAVIVVDDKDFPGVRAALDSCGSPWENNGYMGIIRVS